MLTVDRTACKAVDLPNPQWNFCPNIGAAYLFCILFGLTTIAHIAQAIRYKKAYCWVIIASAGAQTLCYIFRVLSITYPASPSYYDAWFVLILVSPLFTNAFVYMTMGRMVWNFVDSAKIYNVSASRFGAVFVILDIVAFIVQVAGAATAVGNKPANQVLNSLHIYMGGVGIQEFFILVFLAFAIKFQLVVSAQAGQNATSLRPQVLRLLYVLYASLLLISIRIVFRLIEYSGGLKSSIPNHEAFQYSLDSLPMLVALFLFNAVHPGQVMRGKDGDIPGRKERKALGGRKNKEAVEMMITD